MLGRKRCFCTLLISMILLFVFSSILWAETSGQSLLEMMRKSKGSDEKPAYVNRDKKTEVADANTEPLEKVDPFSKYKKVSLETTQEPVDSNEAVAEEPVKKPAVVTKPSKAKKKGKVDKLLGSLPADTLLAVRVNHLEYNFNKLDQFLMDASPLPMGASMMIRSQMAGFFGDPELKSIKMNGNFMVFIVADETPAGEEFNFDDAFIGIMVPITYFKKFVSENPNVGEPDSDGISKISQGNETQARAIKVGQYALITPSKSNKKLKEIAEILRDTKKDSLASTLDDQQKKQAVKEALWVYSNLEIVSERFGDAITEGMDNFVKELKKQEAEGTMPGNPSQQMEMNMAMLKAFMDDGQFITVTVNPKLKVLNASIGLKMKDDSEMAKFFVSNPLANQENRLLGYLDEDAMMNMAIWVDQQHTKDFFLKMVDSFAETSGEVLSQDDIELTKRIISDFVDCAGEALAFTFDMASQKSKTMAGSYVFEIKDVDKLNSALDGAVKLFRSDGMAEFYMGQGLEVAFSLERGVDSYKGAQIDKAFLKMTPIDPENPQGQMIAAMYGDGFNYRWATVDNLFVCTIGDNAEKELYGLIDIVRDGGPKKTDAGIKSTLALLPESKTLEFVGTINYLKQVKAVFSALANSDMPIPKPDLNITSKTTGLAFGGKADKGQLIFNIALPKKHLSEISQFFMSMGAGGGQGQQPQQNRPPQTMQHGEQPQGNPPPNPRANRRANRSRK